MHTIEQKGEVICGWLRVRNASAINPHNQQSYDQYAVFLAAVEKLKASSVFSQLNSGPVIQPCHVRAIRSGPWKLVRYCDPWSNQPKPDQWELYNLSVDGNEASNLLVYNADTFPTLIPEANSPAGLNLSPTELAEIANSLREELTRLEYEQLSPYPSAYPTAGSA